MTQQQSQDAARAAELIGNIIDECPRRVASSKSEQRAHHMLAHQFTERGLDVHWHRFHFSPHLYAVLALHFGVATLGTVLALAGWPLFALTLHLVAGISYYGDSNRQFFLLRSLFSARPSRNLLAVMPAKGEMRQRLLLVAHADAAYTGVPFDPRLVRMGTRPAPHPLLGFTRKGLGLATWACFLLAALDVWLLWYGGGWWHSLFLFLANIPPLIAFALNLDVVLRDEVVPGANDNLSGCAANVILAERLADKPDDVEIVFVCTGAEEAGTGGANLLARTRNDGRWHPDDTTVVAIDGLANGEMRVLVEGEIHTRYPRPELLGAVARVVGQQPSLGPCEPYEIPTGATDGLPFLIEGFPTISLGVIDPDIGAPRNYHLPSDTVENLDLEQLGRSIDLIEGVARELMRDPAEVKRF